MLPTIVFFLCIGIVLGTHSLSILPHIIRAVHTMKQLLKQFPTRHSLHHRIPPHLANYINQVIVTTLQSMAKHPDFASCGSIIIPLLTTPFNLLDDVPSCDPNNVLTTNLDRDSCWFIPAACGQVAIRLPELIRLTHVTIDYLPPEHTMAHHAPRCIVVWGLVDGTANKVLYQQLLMYWEASWKLGDGPPQAGPFTFVPFTYFTYNINMMFPIQIFPSSVDIVSLGITSGLFVVDVQSNWGGNTTGICHVCLHGKPSS